MRSTSESPRPEAPSPAPKPVPVRGPPARSGGGRWKTVLVWVAVIAAVAAAVWYFKPKAKDPAAAFETAAVQDRKSVV